jgi:hypothetical protein
MVWGNLGYIFGCNYISYGLILLRFSVCGSIIMARVSIFRSVYYPGLFIIRSFLRTELQLLLSRWLMVDGHPAFGYLRCVVGYFKTSIKATYAGNAIDVFLP